ncbi:MAG TPA: DUF488 domain-containing protein [Candidatus Saccharimonadales bacterium]|nr:DUF488 domain-containing protein [Candidatus Saccharimonadales bacterium]
MNLQIKRIYEQPSPSDGYRVLVDRLWPRGVSKEHAKLDEWLKEVGPSDDLRKWFGHDPAKYDEFKARYEKELAENPAFKELQKIVSQQPTVTLLYSAHDELHNQAVVLKEYLLK